MVMKVYSSEFKADAVALYLSDANHTYEGVGKDLGISRETLRNWVRGHRASTGETPANRKNVTSTTPADDAGPAELHDRIAALEAELKAVRKDNHKLAQERDILRKATKFFASEMNW
jgi:transposase